MTTGTTTAWERMSDAELTDNVRLKADALVTWDGLPYTEALTTVLAALPAPVAKRFRAATPGTQTAPPLPLYRRHAPAAESVSIRKEGAPAMLQTVSDIEQRAQELVTTGKATDTTDGLQQVFRADPFSFDLYKAAHTPGMPLPVRPATPEPPVSPRPERRDGPGLRRTPGPGAPGRPGETGGAGGFSRVLPQNLCRPSGVA